MVFEEILFTKDECINIIYSAKKFKPTEGVSNFFDNERVFYKDENFKKSYDVFVIENSLANNWIFNRLMSWFEIKSQTTLNRNVKISKALLHKYKKGDLFEKHIDINNEHINRKYNIGIQLNNDYKGGNYNYWIENEMKTFSKEIGNVILYSADIPHEITEITYGQRISFVTHISKKLLNYKNKKLF